MSHGFTKALWQMTFMMVTLWHFCDAFSEMDVTPACNTMKPGHGHEPQESMPPYILEAVPAGDGRFFNVRLRVLSDVKFEGFLIQARNASDVQVGAWEATNKQLSKVIECTPGCAIQHTNENKIRVLMARWYPMTQKGQGPVHFRATVVQHFDKFWMNVRTPDFDV